MFLGCVLKDFVSFQYLFGVQDIHLALAGFAISTGALIGTWIGICVNKAKSGRALAYERVPSEDSGATNMDQNQEENVPEVVVENPPLGEAPQPPADMDNAGPVPNGLNQDGQEDAPAANPGNPFEEEEEAPGNPFGDPDESHELAAKALAKEDSEDGSQEAFEMEVPGKTPKWFLRVSTILMVFSR